MNSRRLPNGFECTTPELNALGFDSMPRGSFWIDSAGAWAVCTTNGRVGSIAKHTVVEHEDGTITVTPSILVYAIPGCTYEPAERLDLVERFGPDQVEAWERGKPELARLPRTRRLERMLMRTNNLDADPIDVNRTAENLGLTRFNLPPAAPLAR